MKVLIIDRDEACAQLLKQKLTKEGYEVGVEASKNEAITRARHGQYNLVFLDPAPLEDTSAIILKLRRNLSPQTYVILLGEDMSREKTLHSGANNALEKPVDPDALSKVLGDARRLLYYLDHIGDTREDFPSSGGIIAKSAFNQLFRSAIERAGRYGERAFIIFITVSNYREIYEYDGKGVALNIGASLGRHLVKRRRQSDIIGQTANNQYALLLQRPNYVNEPRDAANRFSESLNELTNVANGLTSTVRVQTSLMDLPVGELVFDESVEVHQDPTLTDEDSVSAGSE